MLDTDMPAIAVLVLSSGAPVSNSVRWDMPAAVECASRHVASKNEGVHSFTCRQVAASMAGRVYIWRATSAGRPEVPPGESG